MPFSALRIVEQFLREHERELLPSTGVNKAKKVLPPSEELAAAAKQELEIPPAEDDDDDLEFGMLRVDDEEEMKQAMELMLNQFVSDEPLFAALEITRKEAEPYFRELMLEFCRPPVTSYAARDRSKGNKLVAVFMNHLMHRDRSEKEVSMFPVGQYAKYGHKLRVFFETVDILESNIWRILPPNIVQLCHQSFMSVHHEYRRRRIARKLMMGCEAELRRMEGIQGVFAEVSAIGTRRACARVGYVTALSVPYDAYRDANGKPIIVAKDGGKQMDLVYKIF